MHVGVAEPQLGPGSDYFETVLAPAESIYEGTWASGPPPQELVDFEIMRQMRWSWRDLEATPVYVRRYTWDLLNARAAAERDANERGRD